MSSRGWDTDGEASVKVFLGVLCWLRCDVDIDGDGDGDASVGKLDSEPGEMGLEELETKCSDEAVAEGVAFAADDLGVDEFV